MSRERNSQLLLIVSAILSIAIAIALVASIIPSVTTEHERGGTPITAVIAFWLDVAAFLVSGILFARFARTPGRTGRGRRTWTCILGAALIFIGLCFLDAADAYFRHGPEMAVASRVLIVCAVAGGLAGILAVVQACWLARPVAESRES